MNVIDKLVIQLGVKTDTSSFATAQNAMKNMQDKMQNFGNVAGTAFGALISSQAITGIKDQLANMVKMSANMEQVAISYEVMLGSKDKADAMIKSLQKLGKETPFVTTELYQQAQTLMAFGIESNKVVDTLRMLGDVSGGNSEKLNRLGYAFAQIQSAGKLQGQDLQQLINAGFNPLQEISKKTGESMEVLRKKMEKGEITFKQVESSFKRATSEGGRFFKNMEKQAGTATGLWSNIKEVFEQSMIAAGDAILTKIKPALLWLKTFLEKHAETVKNIAIIYGGVLVVALTAATIAFGAFAIGAIAASIPIIKAGLAVMVAWAPIILMFVTIAAGIGLVILIAEDLWKTFTDPTATTLFRTMWNNTLDYVYNKWAQFKSWLQSLLSFAQPVLNKLGVNFGFGATPNPSQVFGAPTNTTSTNIGNIVINTASSDPTAIYNEFQNRLSNQLGMTF